MSALRPQNKGNKSSVLGDVPLKNAVQGLCFLHAGDHLKKKIKQLKGTVLFMFNK